jgi:hypothetical protein
MQAADPTPFARDPAEFRRVRTGLDDGDRRRQGGHPPMSATRVIDPISPELKQVLRTLKVSKMLDTLPSYPYLAK